MQHNPSSHADVVAKYSNASTQDVNQAIKSALEAKTSWEALPFADRASVFLKAADLISTKYRYNIMAATMVGQGKNAWQAEIDAAAELCDFLRYSQTFHFGELAVCKANTMQVQCQIRRGDVWPSTSAQFTRSMEVSVRSEFRQIQ